MLETIILTITLFGVLYQIRNVLSKTNHDWWCDFIRETTRMGNEISCPTHRLNALTTVTNIDLQPHLPGLGNMSSYLSDDKNYYYVKILDPDTWIVKWYGAKIPTRIRVLSDILIILGI